MQRAHASVRSDEHHARGFTACHIEWCQTTREQGVDVGAVLEKQLNVNVPVRRRAARCMKSAPAAEERRAGVCDAAARAAAASEEEL